MSVRRNLSALILWAVLPALAVAQAVAPSGLHSGTVDIRVLAVNDFHGHLRSPRSIEVDGRSVPLGGAPHLAAMIRERRAAHPHTVLVHAGDMVGASPPLSSLYVDEPTIEFMNLVGWDIGAPGNHEFDRGRDELVRLWKGGAHPASLYYPDPFPGADAPLVCANVIDERTGETLLPPYLVQRVGGVRVGFIGAVTRDTPAAVTAEGIRGLRFTDPVAAINKWAEHLARYGVRTIIVLIHEGGVQEPETPEGELRGAILDVVRQLHPEVDLVVSGHSHRYHNAFVGRILVTQARSFGTALAEIELTIDRGSADVIRKSARIVDTLHDGVTPSADVEGMVAAYERLVGPRINRVVAHSPVAMAAWGRETMLGNLIADAQRAAMDADIALMNPGGIRADLPQGPVTWGQLYAIQPFNNTLVRLGMTGREIRQVLERQWGPGSGGQPRETVLRVSGMTYTHDPEGPFGRRVLDVRLSNGRPLEDGRRYSVVMNSFLAGGGDGFDMLRDVTERQTGPMDLDALIDYLENNPGIVPAMGRIQTVK
jgi:5'-nucleotidase